MYLHRLLILGLFILSSPVDSWAEKNYRVVVFGDSITSGYQLQQQEAFPARLEQKLHAAGYDHLDVINMGKENASTSSAVMETDGVAEKLPDVIIVQLGFNDAKRGVVSSAINYNLNLIISALKNTGAYIILVGVPAPESSEERYRYEIGEIFSRIAIAHKITLYPSALEGIDNDPRLTMADGKHPNTAGVEVMVNGILPLVDTGLRWRYEVYEQELQQSRKEQGIVPLPPP